MAQQGIEGGRDARQEAEILVRGMYGERREYASREAVSVHTMNNERFNVLRGSRRLTVATGRVASSFL